MNPPIQAQGQQDGIETRIAEVIGRFEGLKLEINEWEMFLKRQAVSEIEINRQFNSFLKIIGDLANQALLARVDISTCGAIASLKIVIPHIEMSALKGIDPQIDMAPSHLTQLYNSMFRNKLNLSLPIEYRDLWM